MTLYAEPISVLLTPGGGPGILAQLASLKGSQRYSTRAILADLEPASGNLFLPDVDAAYQLPPCDSADYLEQLLALIAQEKINVMYSGLDEEMPVLAAYRAPIAAAGCALVLPKRQALLAALDKEAMFGTLKEQVRMPKTWFLDDTLDDDKIWDELEGNVIIKVTASRGGRGIYIPEDRDEYDFMLRRLRRHAREQSVRFMIQDLVRGSEFNVSSLHDEDGRCIYAVCRRKFESRQVKSTTTAGVIEYNEANIEMALTSVRLLDLTPGFNNTEIIVNEADGLPYLIEVNGGRTAAQDMNLVASGINLTDLLIDLARGEAVDPIPHPADGKAILKIRKDVVIDIADIERRVRRPMVDASARS